MINEVLAGQKRSDRNVLILQILVLISCISFITWITTISIKHDIKSTDGQEARLLRIEYLTKGIQHLAFGFVTITVGLFISVFVLVGNLAIGNMKVSDLPNVFKSETKHLSLILAFFSFTYMVRFISDFWIAPIFSKTSSLKPCILNDGLETLCGPTIAILYAVWMSVLYDFLPLSIIVYFHHKSFRHDKVSPET